MKPRVALRRRAGGRARASAARLLSALDGRPGPALPALPHACAAVVRSVVAAVLGFREAAMAAERARR